MSEIINEDGDLVTMYKDIFSEKEKGVILRSILKHYGDKFESDHPIIMGKRTSPKRKTCQISENGILYRYNGSQESKIHQFTSTLRKAKERIERRTDATYNYALINYYEDGEASIGEHSDNETGLVKGGKIASLSLGDSRYFYFRHKENKERKIGMELENGDLLVMEGTTQKNWKHAVPKRKNKKLRINITFRQVIQNKIPKMKFPKGVEGFAGTYEELEQDFVLKRDDLKDLKCDKIQESQFDIGVINIPILTDKIVKIELITDDEGLRICCLSPGTYNIKLLFRLYDSDKNLYSKTIYKIKQKFSKERPVVFRDDYGLRVPKTIIVKNLEKIPEPKFPRGVKKFVGTDEELEQDFTLEKDDLEKLKCEKLLDSQFDDGLVTIHTLTGKKVEVELIADEGASDILCLSPGKYNIEIVFRLYDSDRNLYSRTIYQISQEFSKKKSILILHDKYGIGVPKTMVIKKLEEL